MKIWLKKAWVFIKTYWYIGVIICIGIIALILGKNKDVNKLFRLVREQRETGRKEIEIIEKSKNNIVEELEENQKEFLEDKDNLDKEFKKKKEELEENRNHREVELSDNIKEDPNKTLRDIAKEMGWDYER